MAITGPEGVWYTTREDVMGALDIKQTARNKRYVDQAIEAASRNVEGQLHRNFYPLITTLYFDWPNFQYAYPWRIWFDEWALLDIPTAVTSGGVTIPVSACNFEPANGGPPYNYVELRRDQPYGFGVGSTPQRNVAITGSWGYRLVETTLGATAGAMNASQTTVTVDGATSAEVGVGSILRVDNERIIVTERALVSTGQTATIGGSKSDVVLTVANGAAFAAEEVLTLDGERVRIDDIAGNNLTVERAYDGTVLAAHTSATVYAPRTLTIARGALGTTAASHSSAATVYEFVPPGLVRQWTRAEALWTLFQERSGWFRKASTSGNGGAEVSRAAIEALGDQARTAHGRNARQRTV